MESFSGLVVLLFAGLCVAISAGLASWMVEPINRVAGHLHLSPRFFLIDFIGLMLLMQGALAVVGTAFDTNLGEDRSPYWQILAVVVALVIILWGAGVSVVSRVGITRMLPRLTVMVVLIPATLAIMVAWPLALVAAVAAWPHRNPYIVLIAAGGVLLLAGATVVVRLLAFWALCGSPGEEVLAKLRRQANYY